jgi:hypothetical protein
LSGGRKEKIRRNKLEKIELGKEEEEEKNCSCLVFSHAIWSYTI